jgi:hypothetical protein
VQTGPGQKGSDSAIKKFMNFHHTRLDSDADVLLNDGMTDGMTDGWAHGWARPVNGVARPWTFWRGLDVGSSNPAQAGAVPHRRGRAGRRWGSPWRARGKSCLDMIQVSHGWG